MSIRARLTLAYVAALVAILVPLGILVWFQFAGTLRGALNDSLEVQVADVSAGLARARAGTSITADAIARAIAARDPAEPGIFTAVFSPSGAIESRSPGVPPGLSRPAAGSSTVTPGANKAGDALVARDLPDGRRIVAGKSLAEVDRSLQSLARLLLGVGGFGALLALGGGWLLAGRALSPVDELAREANAVGASGFSGRVRERRRRDELGRLASALNRAFERISTSVARERAFLAAASHDLRGPITALRTELELATRGPGDRGELLVAVHAAHADAVRLGELANDLLQLAETESSGRSLLRQPVPLRDVLAACIQRTQPTQAERSIMIRVRAPDVVVEVDRVRIEQALVNLLGNAIREAAVNSCVELLAELEPDHQVADTASRSPRRTGPAAAAATDRGSWMSLYVEVLDRGSGVPRELRDLLFVPFATRARGRGEGTGLGLATAAAAIRAHDGEIGYRDRPGGGAAFWFRLPVRARLEVAGHQGQSHR